MREINLLPKNIAFDYKKFLSVKISIAVLSVNIVFLILFSLINIYHDTQIKKATVKEKLYLDNLNKINNELEVYNKNYKNLIKQLGGLKEKEKSYKLIVSVDQLTYGTTIIFLNTFLDGVYFNNVSYDRESFTVTGYAESEKYFQIFYNMLENNKYIHNLRFFYIKKDKNAYNFKITYKVEY